MSYSCLPLNTHPALEADSSPSEPPGNPTLTTAAVNFTYLCLSLGQALFLLYRLPRVHAYLAQSAAQQDKVRRATSHLGSATKMPPVTPLKSFNLICTHMQAQLYLTLCNPMDCSPPGSLSMEFSRQAYWSGLPFPSPKALPDPRMKPASLASPALVGSTTWESLHLILGKFLFPKC